jgi:hypothetical protein
MAVVAGRSRDFLQKKHLLALTMKSVIYEARFALDKRLHAAGQHTPLPQQ